MPTLPQMLGFSAVGRVFVVANLFDSAQVLSDHLEADLIQGRACRQGVYIRVAPDTDLAGYPANIFTGY